jgi:hypothetical protein
VSDRASLGQDENIDERIEKRDDETFFFVSTNLIQSSNNKRN